MTVVERRLTLRRVQAMAYKVKRQGRRTGVLCFLVELRGVDAGGAEVVGLGEGQARDELTGDRGSTSWEMLTECVSRLHEREIFVADARGAVATAQTIMEEFAAVAAEYEVDANRPSPFRGTMLALEVALLDLMARALGVPLADLLGTGQTSVTAHAAPVPRRTGAAELRELLRNQAGKFPATLLLGAGDVDDDLALLEQVSEINRSDGAGGGDMPLWIDLRGKLDRGDAKAFVKAVVDSVAAGRLPREIVIEQPVGGRDCDFMSLLQRTADRRTRAKGLSDVDVRVMTDARFWMPETLGRRARYKLLARRLRIGRRSPRALHLRPAQVGGVLASVELARRVTAAHPDVRICLGSLSGATRVTAGLVRNLAFSIPGLDSVADATVAESAMVNAPSKAGIGESVDYATVLGGATEFFSLPAPAAPTNRGQAANAYPEVTYLQPLGSNGTKGHLLEREALARGLSSVRYSKGAFTITDGAQEPLSFKWSRSPLSSAVSLALCTHKEATRLRLQRAGVPVPRGTTFAADNYDAARAFVRRIGYPVVVKPAMGVRGIGVVANIRDDDALEAAFVQLKASKLGGDDFIVEQHVDGKDYRIVVIGDEVIGAILREPGSVVGDGVRSVGELVVAKNISRRDNPHLWGRPVQYDEAARYQMERAGITLDYVPKPGESVVLSGSCSLSQGGESIDVLDELHPDIKDAAVRAVKAVPGLAFCGVDFLLEDHTKPLDGQQAGICELNAHAAIGNCEYPLYGTGRPVARTLVERVIDEFGLKTTERADALALRLVIRGRVAGVGYRAWMRRRARRYGLTGWVRNIDRRTVEAVVVGGMEPATALVAAAVLGPRAAIPTDVTTTHLDDPPRLDDFEIKRTVKERARAR